MKVKTSSAFFEPLSLREMKCPLDNYRHFRDAVYTCVFYMW